MNGSNLVHIFVAFLLATLHSWSQAEVLQAQKTGQTNVSKESVESDSSGFAVVELFTSQGCSSCPPADKVLLEQVKLAKEKQLPVYALSFHVDYWNRLGWTDPYSDARFSRRQRDFAKANGSDRVYTPQMVINGKWEFVGSNAELAQRGIKLALSKKAIVSIEISARYELSEDHSDEKSEARNNIFVLWKIAPMKSTQKLEESRLNIAIVQKSSSNKVTRGENAGAKLVHVNVVRQFSSIEITDALHGEQRLAVPADVNSDNSNVIAWVQESTSLQAIGGASCKIVTDD